MIRIFLKGLEFDTFAGTSIKQTKQANDIGNIQTKQTNYTNQFELPLSSKNVRQLEYLSIAGNESMVPYRKLECSLFDTQTGECYVRNGWAVISEITDVIKVHVYDGNIDFFKSIENLNLQDLNLQDIKHEKTLEVVKSSWENEKFRYILADYGGKTVANPATLSINIDYLTPSVRVKWLWEKLMDYAGIEYYGSIFHTEYFQNLWMTFPKGLTATDADVLVVEDTEHEYQVEVIRANYLPLMLREAAYYVKATDWDEGQAFNGYIDGIHRRVGKTGTYRIDVSGTIAKERSQTDFAFVVFGKNTMGVKASMVQPLNNLSGAMRAFAWDEPFEHSFVFELNEYDTVSAVIKGITGLDFAVDLDGTNLSITLTEVNPATIDFDDALVDFPATDFTKEIFSLFGLSVFKDLHSDNRYAFLTMTERLVGADVEDWSEKARTKKSEKYIYGKYSQVNVFKHRYNEDNQNYNDGWLIVDNQNLPEVQTLFESKLYTPEEKPVDFFGRPTRVYKTFDAEIKDDGTINYKALDKRFYFIRSTTYRFPQGQKIGSEQLGTEETLDGFVPVESYHFLEWSDALQKFYPPIKQILDRSAIIRVLMQFYANDIANLDFTKLYSISTNDINGTFFLNRVNNFEPGKLTDTELVKIETSEIELPVISFGFGRNEMEVNEGQGDLDIWLTTIYRNPETTLSVPATKLSEYHYRLTPEPGITNITMNVTVKGRTLTSNTLTVNSK